MIESTSIPEQYFATQFAEGMLPSRLGVDSSKIQSLVRQETKNAASAKMSCPQRSRLLRG